MVDLPNLQINGNAVEKPHGAPIPSIRVYTPEAMTPRVMTPEVTTPQVDRPQIAQLPSPLRELSNSLAKASDESNDVAKMFAKQAGFQAVTRDDQGNLIIAKAPIVGDAAVAYEAAVKYTALSFGQNEAKQKDLVLSKQFQGDPDGYLKAAEAFRKAHVNEFTKSAGPEVGAELNKSILNDTTVNYRWLVLDQQKKIAHAFDQGTQAKLQSLETDIDSLVRSGDKGSPQLQEKLDDYHRTVNARIQNPILSESPDVGALRLKGLDLKVGAARYENGINTILQHPQGGVQAAIEANEAHLREKGGDPTQRQIDYVTGQKAIKEYTQNIERSLNLAQKARKLTDEAEEDRIVKDSASPNPTVTENEIKTNPNMSPEAKMRMLGWIKRDGMPEPLAQVSQSTSMDLFRRMNLPEGDPSRITDLAAVRNAYNNGQLKRQDEEWLETRFKEARTPEGEKLTTRRSEFSKAVEPSIDKSNPLMGKIDQTGKLQAYKFQRYVDDKVDEYRQAKKSPYDLFDPSKPDYLGRPEVLRQFQTTIDQSIKNTAQQLRAGGAPSRPARNPGESPDDYLKRTGGQ